MCVYFRKNSNEEMYCGYCYRKANNGIFCDSHSYIWNTLCKKTQKQVEERINDKSLHKRKLQIFVNKIMIMDELNKAFKKDSHV